MNSIAVLLQTTAPAPAGPPGAPQAAGGSMFIFALMLAMMVFMLLTARSQKKREKREREDMYTRLSKNDRVLTIGGAIGTVMTVRENEVVVKVDETNNTKMTFLKTAIQKILADDTSADAKG